MSEIGPADMSASSGFEITPRSVTGPLFTGRALAFEALAWSIALVPSIDRSYRIIWRSLAAWWSFCRHAGRRPCQATRWIPQLGL